MKVEVALRHGNGRPDAPALNQIVSRGLGRGRPGIAAVAAYLRA
jgi:hypothetical protein